MSQTGLKLLLDREDYVVLDKPWGWTTHATSPEQPGLAEIYSAELGKRLFLIHRLDRDTSGLVVMAKSPEAAERWNQLFREHRLEKRYLFLTDRSVEFSELEHQSHIATQGKTQISNPRHPEPNAVTRFKRIKRSPFFTLWEARPKTGKTHQIRLHARELGIPILGDSLYGGSPFPRLCLHAQELKTEESTFTSFPPPFFERMGLLKDKDLVSDLASIDNRQRTFRFLQNPHDCLRLIHRESPNYRIDLFGHQIWIYWYKDEAPSEKDLIRFDFLSDFLGRPWTLRVMQNRGADPNSKKSYGPAAPHNWTAEENNIRYELRSDQGLSPGLFLDQKFNRRWVQNHSGGKRVLNLFSYTGGFSLNAAKGGAKSVTSVDLSKNFMDWSKKNFEINNLLSEQTQFYAMDSFDYLNYAKKKQLCYDLIICDPPSFSRSKKGVFKIEKDLDRLLKGLIGVLSSQGEILFSTNYEGWGIEDLIKRATHQFPKAKVRPMHHSWDFEANPRLALMKSILIQPN